jgi:ubiquinone/menaquinone biosynthesis C-methylase UbiE
MSGDYRVFPEKQGRSKRQQHIEVPLFVRLLGLGQRARILEVGCGAGVALPVFHRLCSPDVLIGVDVDGSALKSAAKLIGRLLPTVKLIQADVRSLPFRDDYFDAVVDFGTCYHIARAGEAGSEISRILKTGGVFATETKLSQFLSHPIRSHGRTMALDKAGVLQLQRHLGLWMSFEKTDNPPSSCEQSHS